MKYCVRCGAELIDEAVVCVKCGCPTQTFTNSQKRADSTFTTLAKVFMIIGTVFMGLFGFLIPLAWCIPMTVSYFNKLKYNQPISTAFKVCSLLFVSLLGGIFMLVDGNE